MATGWNITDALNARTAAAAADNRPKARFRTKDISIKRMYSNKRNFYSMPDIEQLAQEIFAVGLLENLVVAYDPTDEGEYRIIAGERRWRALRHLIEQGHEEFEMVSCQIKTPAEECEETVQLIIANTYRNKTVKDVLEEERRLKETLQTMKDKGLTLQGYALDSGRLRDVIADMLKTSPAKVAQIESINKRLIPEFTAELEDGRLTFSAAYEISGMNAEDQKQMLERYHENGLTFKEVKDIKKQQEEKAKTQQIRQQEQPEKRAEEGKRLSEQEKSRAGQDWQEPHPESVTSLCYSCLKYAECNVKTSTCTRCDRYTSKAEAEKTEEQRYSEEQDAIDRETARKQREKAQEEKMNRLPSENELRKQPTHAIRVGTTLFEEELSGKKNFELVKISEKYRVGDIVEIMEFKDGRYTGRSCKKVVTYILSDCAGLEDDFCILGCKECACMAQEAGQDAAQSAGQDAAQPVMQYGA